MDLFRQFLTALLQALRPAIKPVVVPPIEAVAPTLPVEPIVVPPAVKSTAENIYDTAKASLGKHMTLDNTVPISVGCAQAVSAVLRYSGVIIAKKGISGTAEMHTWLKNNPAFSSIKYAEQGCIIISPTGSGNGKIRGHVGIVGIHGIMSNESQTGLWRQQWDMTSWLTYYKGYGGLGVYYFKAK